MTILRSKLIFTALLLFSLFFPVLVSAEQPPALRQLLKQKDVALQTEWATRYEHGEGVEQSYSRAITLYCSAARRGHALAQYHLGWLYANGRGVDRDEDLAVALSLIHI